MNKIKQKARRARDRLSQRFGGANASTSALIPAGVQGPIQTLRPMSAGGPLPLGNTSFAQQQALHNPVVPNTIAATSSGPVCVVSVPQLVISPCGDSSGVAVPTSTSHEIQTTSPPENLEVGAGKLEPTVPAQNPVVPSALNEAITGAKDNVTTPPATVQNTEPSLWERAFNKLSDEDRNTLSFPDSDEKNSLESILEATRKSRDVCLANRMKFTFRGKDIIVRDVAEKLLTWVDKFKTIGDIATQFDAVHTALPWAGVRFLLQIAFNNKETMEVVLIGVEAIARLLLRCTIYENLYLKSGQGLAIRPNLGAALEELYTAILVFLAFAKCYLDKSTSKRMFDGLLDVEGGSRFDRINDEDIRLVREVRVAEAEMREHDQGILEAKSEELRVLLEAMEKPIARIDLNVGLMYGEFHAHIQGEKRRTVLEWISKIEYEKHHLQANEDMLEDTGQWLLNKPQFREWQCSSASGILWLHGIPGAGKTKLTCTVINVLRSDAGVQGPVVYFYCNRNDEQRRDPTVIVQALVRQLSVTVPGLPTLVVAAYDKRVDCGLGTLGFQECIDFLVTLLELYPQTTIIIDALDESDPNERWRLIEALTTMVCSSATLVKIFISSRDDIDIKLHFEKVPNVYIDVRDNSADIARFVRREVTQSIERSRFLRRNVTEEFKEEIILTIQEKANGMFQWADLQIKHLARLKLVDDIKKDLGKLPETLDDSYSQIWTEILTESSLVREITTRALMWVMCAREGFGQEEWAEASYHPEPVPEGGIDTLLDFCRNLVMWNAQLRRMRFAHLSVQEYLEKKIFNSVDANSMAVKSCLSLVRNLQWGTKPPVISSLGSGGRRPHTLFAKPLAPFALYATANWPYHVELCYDRSIGEEILGILQAFLGTSTKPSEAYVRWLRVAGLVRNDLVNTWPRTTTPCLVWLSHVTSRSSNLFLICYFRFGEALNEILECDGLDSNENNTTGETLLSVASMQGNELVMNILLGNGATPRTYYGALEAAIQGGRAGAVVKLLDWGASKGAYGRGFENILEIGARFGDRATVKAMMEWGGRITEAVLIAASANGRHAKELIKVLVATDANFRITEAGLVAAAACYDDRIIEALLARDANIEITEVVLVAALNNRRKKGVVKMLLARYANIEITETVLVTALKSAPGVSIIQMVLVRDANIEITEAVLVAAAQSDSGKETIEMLLARDANIEITEAVLVAAAEFYSGKETIEMLLARDANLGIPEAVLVAVAKYSWDAETMELLLARDANLEITEAVLVAAANSQSGKETIELLLARDANIEITEAVLAAALNSWRNKRTIDMVLARYANIEITEAVLVAAADSQSGKETTVLLLARDANPEIPEEVLVTALKRLYQKGIAKMLLARDPNIEITESVLRAAAGNSSDGVEFTNLLLARNANLKITEVILQAAAGNYGSGKDIIWLLLELDTNIETLEVILAQNPDLSLTFMDTLLRARREFIAFNPTAPKSKLCIEGASELPQHEQRLSGQRHLGAVEDGSRSPSHHSSLTLLADK